MAHLFDRIFNRKPSSASHAKDRLRVVLMHDRAALTPSEMTMIKDEIISSISRHVEIETESVKFKISSEGRRQRLIADIPLRTKR
jgi:cell division topological specificity factor